MSQVDPTPEEKDEQAARIKNVANLKNTTLAALVYRARRILDSGLSYIGLADVQALIEIAWPLDGQQPKPNEGNQYPAAVVRTALAKLQAHSALWQQLDWPARPFDPACTQFVPIDQTIIDVVRLVLPDWDGQNWSAVREHLITMGRTEEQLVRMTPFDVRMAYSTGQAPFIALSGRPETNTPVTMSVSAADTTVPIDDLLEDANHCQMVLADMRRDYLTMAAVDRRAVGGGHDCHFANDSDKGAFGDAKQRIDASIRDLEERLARVLKWGRERGMEIAQRVDLVNGKRSAGVKAEDCAAYEADVRKVMNVLLVEQAKGMSNQLRVANWRPRDPVAVWRAAETMGHITSTLFMNAMLFRVGKPTEYEDRDNGKMRRDFHLAERHGYLLVSVARQLDLNATPLIRILREDRLWEYPNEKEDAAVFNAAMKLSERISTEARVWCAEAGIDPHNSHVREQGTVKPGPDSVISSQLRTHVDASRTALVSAWTIIEQIEEFWKEPHVYTTGRPGPEVIAVGREGHWLVGQDAERVRKLAERLQDFIQRAQAGLANAVALAKQHGAVAFSDNARDSLDTLAELRKNDCLVPDEIAQLLQSATRQVSALAIVAEGITNAPDDRFQQEKLDRTTPIADKGTPSAGDLQHAPDFTWFNWGPERFEFTRGNQSETVRVLYEDYLAGGRGLSTGVVAQKIGASDGFRVDATFRLKSRIRHPAWGKMICRDPERKSIYRYFPPV